MRRKLALLPIFMLADMACSLVSLGFYSPNWSFEKDRILNFLLFLDGYSFVKNPIDFCFLSLFRVLFLTLAIVLILIGKEQCTKKLFMAITLFSIFCYSFTLVKLLALSELPIQLTYPGLYLSCSTSIIASLLFMALWYFVITKHEFNYQRLVESVSHSVESVHSTPAENQPLFHDLPTQEASKEEDKSSLQHIKRLLSYCREQWFWFLFGFIFLCGYAVARVFIPSMMGQVIGDIVKNRGFSTLVKSVITMGILTFVSSIFGGLRGGCFDYATAKVSRRIRLDLFGSLVRQDIAFFDINKSGEMVSRLTSDCQTMSSTVSTNLNVFLRNGVMLIGALVYMFCMSWRLATVTFIAVPVVGFITKWYGGFFDKLSEKMQYAIGKANNVAEEVLSSMRTVRSFACEKQEIDRFSSHLDVTLSIAKVRSIAYMGYTWTNELCDNSILVAVLFYGGWLVMTEKMATDELITFLLYQMQLGENLYNIGYVFTGLMESVGASRKVFNYMNRKPDITMDGRMLPAVNGSLELNNIHFSYPSRPNNQVLKGLNLSIPAGETVALVGPSGGGKSSIVSLIQHFYEPNMGDIKLDGIDIKNISHTYYHQKIALVAQEPVLYNGSVRYNILYGCDFGTEEDMLNASRMANVHSFIMEMENGYDTECGEKGVQMSGGQKQRIAIARALVRRPSVLILDEATSALDAESEALVQEALNRCAKERTVLIVAHRLSTIEKADKIAVIQKGAIQQIGSHNELMTDKEGLYYSLVARQLLSSKVGEKDS